jgi:hypothetical protein
MAEIIVGKVTEITPEGDLLTDIMPEQIAKAPSGEGVRILVDDEHETFGIFPADHHQPAMTLIAISQSDGPLRLHLVGDSASLMLGVGRGANVQVKW